MSLSPFIVTRLRHQHEILADLTRGLTEEQLQQHPIPGKWSPFQQIAHLTAYQPVFISRLDRMLAEDDPAFDRYVAENDPQFSACLQLPLTQLLQDTCTNGAIIADRMAGLDDAALLRKGRHPRYGLLVTADWAEFYLLHEAHHLFSIFMMVQDLRAGSDR